MALELRPLSVDDGRDVYEMLQRIPSDENGFVNSANGQAYDEFKAWLAKSERMARGEGLEDWQVAQAVYWLVVDGEPVGMGKLRAQLTDRLREEGGHCGYAIAPAHRGKGYATALLRGMVRQARDQGIDRMLVTVLNHNEPSIRVALKCGGVIERVSDARHYIWIDCGKARV